MLCTIAVPPEWSPRGDFRSKSTGNNHLIPLSTRMRSLFPRPTATKASQAVVFGKISPRCSFFELEQAKGSLPSQWISLQSVARASSVVSVLFSEGEHPPLPPNSCYLVRDTDIWKPVYKRKNGANGMQSSCASHEDPASRAPRHLKSLSREHSYQSLRLNSASGGLAAVYTDWVFLWSAEDTRVPEDWTPGIGDSLTN